MPVAIAFFLHRVHFFGIVVAKQAPRSAVQVAGFLNDTFRIIIKLGKPLSGAISDALKSSIIFFSSTWYRSSKNSPCTATIKEKVLHGKKFRSVFWQGLLLPSHFIPSISNQCA